jgi:hypothetical protein
MKLMKGLLALAVAMPVVMVAGGAAPTYAADSTKKLFLYVGPTKSGTPYPTYSVSDINMMTNVNEFVICLSPDWETYKDGSTGMYSYTTAVNAVTSIVNTIKASNKASAQVWIATPAITSMTPSSSISAMYTPISNYIDSVKSALGSYWTSNVKGIYMNQEAIYGTVDYANLMANSSVKLMNDVSYRVHSTHNKKFMWAPYYSTWESSAAENIKRVGYVTNTTNIYDQVFLQPSYYFTGIYNDAPITNLDGVYYSVSKQAVSYRNNVTVVTRSPSATATIGVQMEIDSRITWDSAALSRYNAYESKFGGFRGSYPFSYYAGNRDSLAYSNWTPMNRINSFYAY